MNISSIRTQIVDKTNCPTFLIPRMATDINILCIIQYYIMSLIIVKLLSEQEYETHKSDMRRRIRTISGVKENIR